ncbi:MAG: protease pro-enzyme activation domain-containing protein, partial [Acidobacteriaceae bacterium]
MFRFRRFFLTSLCCAALGFVPLAAQTAPNRIPGPIDQSQLVSLHGNVAPLAEPRFDQGPAPLSLPTGRIALILGHSPAQQRALNQFLDDVQNPSSPHYHHWLTPAQYGALYGPSDADLQTVEAWLQSNGFQIDEVPEARNFIRFSGNIEQLQTAFHTSIHTFAIDNRTHFANVTDPEIPAALAPVVAGITPLNDFHPCPNLERPITAHYDDSTRSIQPDLTLFNSSNNPRYLFVDPADAATIYDSPNAALNPNYSGATWDGAGVSIGILGVSDLTLSDVLNYRVAFLGETAASANLPTIVVDGDDPG